MAQTCKIIEALPMVISLRSKVLIISFIVAWACGFAFFPLSPNNNGALASFLWLFVLFPSILVFIAVSKARKWLRKRQERRLKAKDQFRPSATDNRTYPKSSTVNNNNNHRPSNRIVHQPTLNGELVKSGGERLIADYFYENGIRYEYEKPAFDSTGKRISRPDFFLPDYGTYVEYWGMVNSDEKHERQEYIKSMEWKIKRYHENHMKFISIYPEDLGNLDAALRDKLQQASQA